MAPVGGVGELGVGDGGAGREVYLKEGVVSLRFY